MKQYISFPSLLFGLLLAGLWGCADDTNLPSEGSDNDGQGTLLTVNVVDNGYLASAGEAPTTRAQEEGYKTTFIAGDKIGLYVQSYYGDNTENICLTLSADGKWTPPAGTTLAYEGVKTTYYAYYPYQTDMTNKVRYGTNADDFFMPLVKEWIPAADQSSYAKYTAQDLMIGKGTISGTPGSTRTLTFTLSHRMALVLLDLPKAKYTLSNDAGYTWLTDALNTGFYGFSPYHLGAGAYRFLVNPWKTNLLFSGTYTDASAAPKEWELKPGITAGKYKTYTVDNGAVVNNVSHVLQSGDFFMKDGSLLAASRTELNEEEQANCIGIVFRIGTGSSDAVDNYEGKLTTIHGYVLALQQSWQTWGDGSRVFGTGTSGGAELGYKSTQMIMAAAASESRSFPACFYCVNYTPAPTGVTSGWYYPTTGQMRNCAINANSNGINTQLGKIPGAAIMSGTYSSSSETNAGQVWGARVGSGSYYYLGKGSNLTRAVLTF